MLVDELVGVVGVERLLELDLVQGGVQLVEAEHRSEQ